MKCPFCGNILLTTVVVPKKSGYAKYASNRVIIRCKTCAYEDLL